MSSLMGIILTGFWLCNDINAECLFTFDFVPFGQVGSQTGDLIFFYICVVCLQQLSSLVNQAYKDAHSKSVAVSFL